VRICPQNGSLYVLWPSLLLFKIILLQLQNSQSRHAQLLIKIFILDKFNSHTDSKKCCTMILKLSNPTCQESLLVLWYHEIFSMFLVTSLLYLFLVTSQLYFMKYTISEREWWKWNILYRATAVHYLNPRDAGTMILQMVGTTCPVHRITSPEDLNVQ
jgi:hypothetical protein